MSAIMSSEAHTGRSMAIMHRGSIAGLGELIAMAGAPAERLRVLVVTSPTTPERAWYLPLSRTWAAFAPLELRLGGGSTVHALELLLAATAQEPPDVVVAVGGGSVLDAGKVLSALIGRSLGVREALDRQLDGEGVPLIAVPTLAGSGAEVTSTATVWDPEAGRKHSIGGPALQPNLVLVDADLATSAPLGVSIPPVLDALVQGVEAAWSPRARSATQTSALEAVGLAARTIPQLIARPGDPLVREAAASASLRAGRAIAQTTTGLCHALSYPLTISYGIAHGHACAMVLPAVFTYNSGVGVGDCCHPSGLHATRQILRAACAQLGSSPVPEAIGKLLASSGLQALDSYTGLSAGALVEEALSYDRCRNNPREIDRAALTAILDREVARI
jgi:alcohol dehydrogenase class IV